MKMLSIRNKKVIVAIEWLWLLVGVAVVLAYLVEAWAAPYMPMIGMLGVILLFVVYRFGVTVRQMYWPEPDDEEEPEPVARPRRRGGDGMTSTTEWVPPHIRGRSVPQERKQRRQDKREAVKLAIPAADGDFENAEVPTVFAEVDEQTDPASGLNLAANFQPTLIVDVGHGGLRPETEADMTGGEIVVPSFAESALSREEREHAIAVASQIIDVRRHAPPLNAALLNVPDEETTQRPSPPRAEADETMQTAVPAKAEADETMQTAVAPRAEADETLQRTVSAKTVTDDSRRRRHQPPARRQAWRARQGRRHGVRHRCSRYGAHVSDAAPKPPVPDAPAEPPAGWAALKRHFDGRKVLEEMFSEAAFWQIVFLIGATLAMSLWNLDVVREGAFALFGHDQRARAQAALADPDDDIAAHACFEVLTEGDGAIPGRLVSTLYARPQVAFQCLEQSTEVIQKRRAARHAHEPPPDPLPARQSVLPAQGRAGAAPRAHRLDAGPAMDGRPDGGHEQRVSDRL